MADRAANRSQPDKDHRKKHQRFKIPPCKRPARIQSAGSLVVAASDLYTNGHVFDHCYMNSWLCDIQVNSSRLQSQKATKPS